MGEARRAGGTAGPRGLRGVRRPRPVAGRGAAADGPVPRLGGPVFEGRPALRSGRGAAPAGPRADPGAHRGGGPRRLLPRRDGGPRRARDGRERRHHDPRRPRRLPRRAPCAHPGNLPRPRGALHAPHQLGGDRDRPDAQHPGARRPRGVGVRVGGDRPPDDRGDAARLRRPRAPSRRPRVQPRDAGRAADLEGLRGGAAADHRRRPGVGVLARLLRVAARGRRDHPPVGGRRDPQRGVADLHPRAGLRVEDHGAGGGVPAQQRDGRLQRRPRPDHRLRAHRDRAEPRRARQAHAVEHVADHRHPGRAPRAGDGEPGRADHHQHRAADDSQRRRPRHERAGGGGRAPHPPPVAARRHALRAVGAVARHPGPARGAGPRDGRDAGAGAVSAIYYDAEEDMLEGAEDRRRTSAAVGF